MDPAKYADIFLEESREHLTTVNQQLLEWERDPASAEPVKIIFRAMHNIKGMAATMGYSVVATLAHRAENLLDHFRSSGTAIDSGTLQLLFRTTDGIEEAIERTVDGGTVSDAVTALVGQLDTAMAVHAPAAPGRAGPSSSVAGGTGRPVRVSLKAEAQLKGARAALLLARMEQLGVVSGVEPSPAEMVLDSFHGEFRFIIDSAAADTDLERIIRRVGDVASVEIRDAIQSDERSPGKPEARSIPPKPMHLRVDLRRLDALMNLVGELVSAHGALSELSGLRGDGDLDDVTVRIARITRELQAEVNEARMTPAWQVFDRFPRLVRDVALKLGKRVEFRMEGKEIEVDKSILDRLGDPLVHLLRNAVDHGIESPEKRRAAGKPEAGRIVLSAGRERSGVVVRVSDDGRGIDPSVVAATGGGEVASAAELLSVLARPGFSTAKSVSDVSGRGVGIDAVVSQLQALGGSVELQSQSGSGSTFTLRLPSTLAIVPALLANVDTERYALPLTHVEETLDLDVRSITDADGQETIILRDHAIPLVRLGNLIGANGPRPARQPVVVMQIGDRRSALVVDRISGQRDIVVKSITLPRGTVPIFSGATILGDGRAVLILDAARLVQGGQHDRS